MTKALIFGIIGILIGHFGPVAWTRFSIWLKDKIAGKKHES